MSWLGPCRPLSVRAAYDRSPALRVRALLSDVARYCLIADQPVEDPVAGTEDLLAMAVAVS